MATFAQDFEGIDLSRPWLEPFLAIHQAYQADGQTPLADWLNTYFKDKQLIIQNNAHQSLLFTHQSDLPHGVAYEKFIGDTGKIPTRDNLHDWFGACIWATYPKSKAMLNFHHLKHLNDDDTNNKRNRVRDTITVFDENGAIVVVCDDNLGYGVADALVNFKWQSCLVDSRPHWHNPKNPKPYDKAQVLIFGHALLEQLITPRKPLCSHAMIINVPPPFFGLSLADKLAFIDEWLCHQMDNFLQKDISPKQLHPLPILGVPYFWDNQDDEFYQDTFVFRSGRKGSEHKNGGHKT